MTSEGFDPQRWDHWFLAIAFVACSSGMIWKVYLES
jgi:hypothetical protein